MSSFSERYHELTKYNPLSIDSLGEPRWNERVSSFRMSRNSERHELNHWLPFLGQEKHEIDWKDFVPDQRTSCADGEILSKLLFFSGGVTGIMHTQEGPIYLRSNPSAGGLYPVETYVAIRNSADFEDGLYAFHPLEAYLEPIDTEIKWEQWDEIFQHKSAIHNSDILMIFTGLTTRNTWRYFDRAYRRTLLDTGHMVANANLYARSLGFNPTLLGGFKDRELDKVLQCEPYEYPLLGLAVQQPSATASAIIHSASAPPAQAVQRLDNQKSFQEKQNQVERIERNFRRPDILPSATQMEDHFSQECDHLCETADIMKVIAHRRSARQFTGESLNLDEINTWLKYSCLSSAENHLSHDFLEVHLIHREGNQGQCYQIDSQTRALTKRDHVIPWSAITQASLGQGLVNQAGAVVFYTVDLSRITQVFGDRGYRYVSMDAGLHGERLHLAANFAGKDACGIGGYFDDICNEVLNLGVNEAILYGLSLGIS